MRTVGIRIGVAIVGCLLCAPIAAQVTQRVSITWSGAGSPGDFPSISADGRYVAFFTSASDVVPGDTNGVYDVFVRDRQNGTNERVSVNSNGGQGNGISGYFLQLALSADGRFVAFLSDATNLVLGDTNGSADIFVHDRQSGTTERVSVDSSGVQGNGHSYYSSISGDGRHVAFASEATNLVPGDTNLTVDVFVHDRQSGTTERVSVDSAGVEGNNTCAYEQPSISADGRYVAFSSRASNLVPGDTNGWEDVFVRDRQAGTTERVSVDSGGGQFPTDSRTQSISADGRYVAFVADFALSIVLLRDRQNATTTLVSIATDGTPANNDCSVPCISADGHHVAFVSLATNLVPGDTAGAQDAFVRDLLAGVTERVSVSSAGVQANGHSYIASVSADGRYVAIDANASNLVPMDTILTNEIFVRDRQGGPSFTSLCDPGMSGVIACPCGNGPGGLGQGCDNSAGTGGAILSASGGTIISSDSLMFTTNGERATATSIVLQGDAFAVSGVVYGQGVRCVGGTLKRLFVKTAVAGSITAPDFGAGDPTVSARSAAKGDVIQLGQSRWYLVYYRDPVVLGGCPASSTFNATQAGRVDWSP
jgi:Tol biopolymer transport system component